MPLKRSTVCVVVPCYKAELKAFELLSLERCISVLAAHPLIVIKPRSLDLSNLFSAYPTLMQEEFADEYFSNIQGYNRLMLSNHFYARFADRYRYMLIHQLDAFVFSDQLLRWCEYGYDFVGAPWLPPPPHPRGRELLRTLLDGYLARWSERKQPDGAGADPTQYMFRVGNGGFSLRKISKMLSVLEARPRRASQYRELDHFTYNEDLFFCIDANRYWPRLRIPSYKTASRFSWEAQPRLMQHLNKGHLPFGCHAFDKFFRDEWRPIFKQFEIDIDRLLSDA